MLNKALYPFQAAGVKFLNRKHGNALLADEMGLGKTIQAISYASLNPKQRPVLVICPASLKWNWAYEVDKWLEGATITVVEGTQPWAPNHLPADWYIINYDILHAHLSALQELSPELLICDEAHYLKSHNSQRSKAVKILAKGIPHRILITGTPLLNRPIELWNLLNTLDEKRWPNRWAYARRYCDAKQKRVRTRGGGYRQIWDLSGASNLDELHVKLQDHMIRRTKDQVLQELPDKTRSVIPVPISYYAYRKFLNETRDKLFAEDNPAAIAVLIEKLKQHIVEQKMPTAIEWIRDFIEQEYLVLFVTHRDVANRLHQEFREKSVIITGDTPANKRQEAVDRFQKSPEPMLFIGNLQAAGVGLTLTAASNVAFLELGWTPGEHLQAEDRVHRIGQRNSVNVWYLLGDGTIDDWIFNKLNDKRQVIERVLAGHLTQNGFNKNDMIREAAEFIKGGAG